MNKRLEISIPQSCPENWASMSQVAGGAYCLSCQKKVTDFTALNHKEIEEWFLQHKNEKICGRFYSSQLTVQVEHMPKEGAWTTLRTKILAASILIFPFTLKASGLPIKKQKIEAAPVSARTSNSHYCDQQTLPEDSVRTIKGVVLDKATKEVLPGVTVIVKGTRIKSFSDSKGNFQISFNRDISPILVTSYIGYQTFEQKVRSEAGKPFTIVLVLDQSILGEVCIVKKPSFLKRIIRPFKKNL
ncbi:carboxypeptidase-like regulatory domain-containing protein [Pedobacter sp. PLR]|uniref:carboxypeptidase-like regulatory domain-containing protein n=1 Tax=Pedobacter sp. PLR TaxID=2994465 RepID=UPI0022486000|nr:carboxypeptidase-like regulatory domain-containing protein [Pedobacter sp. PLR]MCX2453851.1 carboxypeptidase-like regulatory domain-containing protein [Pedobacter sp. PLR]